ncbi:hypothetical protein [Pedobacter suwonensis]|uniref:hypothetical protein n=1 Tax=Pedobacter suwonensis TaxID=332999 RepID=UPI00119F38C3|nr:hypothetical protein [Pedobacter suwonensis]
MISIGITGHQNLNKHLVKGWLKKQLHAEISVIPKIICAYSSLAIGADQLFAEVILRNNIDLIALIPCEDYIQTFRYGQQKKYRAILELCCTVEVLGYQRPSEQAFLRAGQIVADRSDILFAIWDGKPAKGTGGTADIVEYALGKGKRILHFDINAQKVNILNH